MKIVNRVEFLKLPCNTLFSEYHRGKFKELKIKGNTIAPNDFHVQYINDSISCESFNDMDSILKNAELTGKSFNMDFDIWSRDGLYDPDETLYSVWEEDDVKQLIVRFAGLLK